jgi:hypothetical protein
VRRAQDLVREQFPEASAAFLGGSAASGQATKTSDLDILVVLSEARANVSYVQSTRFQGQLVEAFVYGPGGLQQWLEKGRTERRPVLDKLIAEGIVLTEGAHALVLKEASKRVLGEGPTPLRSDELRLRRYVLSATLDDLADATDRGETFVLAANAWKESAELALLLDGRWLGNGKWLLRELRVQPDRHGLVRCATTDNLNVRALTIAGRSVLEAAGGYLQDGFVRGDRPADM